MFNWFKRKQPERPIYEVCVDTTGELLWVERWIFRGIWRPGQTFRTNSKDYLVVACTLHREAGVLFTKVSRQQP